jgi:hypothetical protein
MTERSTSIVVATFTYDITQVPSKTAPLTLAEKQNILGALTLDGLIGDMNRVNDLLFVAYCGVRRDKNLAPEVSGLMWNYLDICDKATLATASIRSSAEEIVGNMETFFQFVYMLQEDAAIDFLASCADAADRMSTEATKLSGDFKELATSANDIQKKTLAQQGLDEEARRAALARINQIEADQAEADSVRAELSKAIDDTKKRYEEAVEKENKADDRAFAAAITGMVMGGLSQAAGAFAGAYMQANNPGAAIAGAVTQGLAGQQPPPANAAAPESTGKPKVAAAAEEDAEDDSEAAEEGTAETAGAEKAGTAGENETAGKHEAAGGKEAAGEPAEAAKPEVKAAAQDLRQEKLAAAKAAAAAAQSVREDAQAMSGTYNDIAAGYHQERMKHLELQLALEKQQREILGSLAKYGKLLSGEKATESHLEVSVQALDQAIGALRQIAGALATAALFWAKMAAACRELNSTQMSQRVGALKAKPEEVRLTYYYSEPFKKSVIGYYCKWLALWAVAEDYAKAIAATREAVRTNYEKNPSLEDAPELARSLGEALASSADRELKRLAEKSRATQAEHDALQIPDKQAA